MACVVGGGEEDDDDAWDGAGEVVDVEEEPADWAAGEVVAGRGAGAAPAPGAAGAGVVGRAGAATPVPVDRPAAGAASTAAAPEPRWRAATICSRAASRFCRALMVASAAVTSGDVVVDVVVGGVAAELTVSWAGPGAAQARQRPVMPAVPAATATPGSELRGRTGLRLSVTPGTGPLAVVPARAAGAARAR